VPGQVFDEDEEGRKVEITNGRDLANMFPGDSELGDVLLKLYMDNRLTEDQKKKLRSRSDSGNGSSIAPSQATPGETPAPVATLVVNAVSVSPEGATEPANPPSSGTTVLSSSEPVPCGT